MKCKLYKQVDHSKIREQFRKTLIECPLLSRNDVGMSSVGIVCGGCCIRIQQLLEAKKDLLLRQVIALEDYKRKPELIEEHLPEHLQQYYQALKKLGKSLEDITAECSRCKPVIIEDRPVYADEATEITACGRNDLR